MNNSTENIQLKLTEELDELEELNELNELDELEELEELPFIPKYKNLVLSGGSVKGISHIGAIKRLVEVGLLDLKKIDGLAGSSVGSIIALLIVLGFNIDEIWQFAYMIDMKRLINPNLLIVFKKCGIETGQLIHNIFEEILTKKTGIKHINFRQLYEITKIHLTIVGSCLTTKEVVYYDHINYPNFKVSTAVRISISIPGLFIPVIIDGKKYIDGAILNNYAMNLFDDKIDTTIGILICNEYNTDYTYFEEYPVAVMNLFMYNYYQKTADQYRDNTIYINKVPKNISIISFDIDEKNKIDLMECGVAAVNDFIKRTNQDILKN